MASFPTLNISKGSVLSAASMHSMCAMPAAQDMDVSVGDESMYIIAANLQRFWVSKFVNRGE